VLAGTGPLCCVEILVEAAGEQQDHEAAPAVPTGKAQDQAPPPALPEAEDDLPMLDQVELLQQSLEGRKRLREHLERGSAIRASCNYSRASFRRSYAPFANSTLRNVYGPIGRGFIEAHHLVACFNEFETILRFASVATIGEGGDHGWEGDCGKEVRCEAEQRGTPAA
jgi:hypothetical protein